MIAFIDYHCGAHGGEPACRVLPIATLTYQNHIPKRADSDKLSARAKRGLKLKQEIERVSAENFEVYGAQDLESAQPGSHCGRTLYCSCA